VSSPAVIVGTFEQQEKLSREGLLSVFDQFARELWFSLFFFGQIIQLPFHQDDLAFVLLRVQCHPYQKRQRDLLMGFLQYKDLMTWHIPL
jgi:hypothetical protein